MKIILYHGSDVIVEKPIFGYGNKFNDYGLGFYCTSNFDLACEWACIIMHDGYVNKYEIELDNLKILDLTIDKYNILNWLAILLDNRKVNLPTPISKLANDYILKKYLIDYKKYDIIIGYRADDSYFSFVRSFLTNQISLSQLEYAMKLGKLGLQTVIISKKAFEKIKFINYEIAPSSKYYSKRINRDLKARESFNEMLLKEESNGIFIKDLMKGNNHE